MIRCFQLAARRKKQLGEEDLGIPVDASNFTRKCALAIGRRLDCDLTTERGDSMHQSVFDLRQRHSSVTDEKDGRRQVIPFFITGAGGLLWYGVRLQLNSQETRLQHVQIRLLAGALTSPKICLLRMEWDTREKAGSEDSKHAQPHWQVDPEALASTPYSNFKDFARDSTPFEPVSSTEPERSEQFRDRLDILHLAMGATFHRRPALSSVAPEEVTAEAVVFWLAACIDYLRQELVYMNRKIGRMSATI
jgi:hypothetical protein